MLYSCAVYHASRLLTSGQPVKIPQQGDPLTKVFSYADAFLPALSQYVSGHGARPEPHVQLLCGQAVSLDTIDHSAGSESILVRVRVTSLRALNDLHAADTTVSSDSQHFEEITKRQKRNDMKSTEIK